MKDPFEELWKDLAALDAAYDQVIPEDESIDWDGLSADFLQKLGEFDPPSPEAQALAAAYNELHSTRVSQAEIVSACLKHDQLTIVYQNDYYLVGSNYFGGSLIYPDPRLGRDKLSLFISEMWGQWVEIPSEGWEIRWDLDLINFDEYIMNPFIVNVFSQAGLDLADDI